MRTFPATAASLLLALAAGPGLAQEADPPGLRDLHPAAGLGRNLAESLSGWNLALHAAAIASTAVLVGSGGDTAIHNALVEHDGFARFSTPGVYLVYAMPLFAGGALAAVGLARDSRREVAASGAVLQATALTLLYQGVLKGLTGRPSPDPVRYDSDRASRTFRFGLLRGGVHYGWPSGHLMTTTAVLTSLLPLYPDSLALRIGGGALFAYVLASVATHDHNGMHWASDIVAGTLMGYAIGRSVGSGFAQRLGARAPASGAGFAVAPLVGVTRGLVLRGEF